MHMYDRICIFYIYMYTVYIYIYIHCVSVWSSKGDNSCVSVREGGNGRAGIAEDIGFKLFINRHVY